MSTDAVEKTPLESALEALTRALEAWDPDEEGGVGAMLAELREVQLYFDPRRQRLPSVLCLSSMRLLEELAAHGAARPSAVVDVVRELSAQMRTALESAPAAPVGGGIRMLKMTPPAMPAAESRSEGGGLSLRLVDDLRLGEMMVRMSMISQQDCDRVMRTQAAMPQPRRRFGELCVELGLVSRETLQNAIRMQARGHLPRNGAATGPDDPWGDKPL